MNLFNFSQNNTHIALKLKKSSKGQSRDSRLFQNKLPFNFVYKKLTFFKKNQSGTTKNGIRTLRTRGKVFLKKRFLNINYSFRLAYLNFLAGYFFIPFYNKLIALTILSNGSVTYLRAHSNFCLFNLQKFYTFSKSQLHSYFLLKTLNSNLIIKQNFYLISQLPKNKPISLLELYPLKTIQYIRSTGSSGKILKIDFFLQKAIIKLPSGVQKFFSTHSIGSNGSIALPQNKFCHNKKAGFYKKFGFKSIVRGVAMNPVDHPHGGRTKAIKYQRTP